MSVAGALPSKKQRPRRIVNLPRVPVAVRRSSHAARGGARLVPFSHMPSAHAIAALSMAKLFVSKLKPGLRRSWSRLRRPSEIKIKVIYLVRHAEAMHNVEEKRVVGLSLEAGLSKSEADLARKTALETNDALKDAPLSTGGHQQIQSALEGYQRLLDRTPYCAPEIVLVSPLRRTLQTATRLFGSAVRIVAVELLREKRTGMACDERSSVAELAAEFPQVEFQEIEAWISTGEVVPEGEDNAAVRKRAARFLDDDLPRREASTLAVVSHKGYLRELRAMLKERADNKHSNLQLDFDLNLEVTGTVFGNAEARPSVWWCATRPNRQGPPRCASERRCASPSSRGRPTSYAPS